MKYMEYKKVLDVSCWEILRFVTNSFLLIPIHLLSSFFFFFFEATKELRMERIKDRDTIKLNFYFGGFTNFCG